jgi:predicted GIY-YIG superfamily endonuclease
MKHYVYILNTRAKILNIGWCKDIVKALKFYNDAPAISLEENYSLFKILYLVEHPNQASAEKEFYELHTQTKKQLIAKIKTINPQLVELKPGENIEL